MGERFYSILRKREAHRQDLSVPEMLTSRCASRSIGGKEA
jgi:hypothetical protein